MTEFTITHPIRMNALYPEARIGDLFVATHERYPNERVVLIDDSCGQATFASEYGDVGVVSRQFGKEWTLQHVGRSWVNEVRATPHRASRVAEMVLQSLAPLGCQPSFDAAFQAGMRYIIETRGAYQ